MLRDRIVCGFNDSRLQRRLLAEKDLTFKKALEMAQAWEAAESNAKDLQKPLTPAVHRLGKEERSPRNTRPPEGSCSRCGGQHRASDCRFKTATCHFCKKKGHLAKVCRSKPQGQRPLAPRRPAPPHKTHRVEDGHEDEGDAKTYSLFAVTGERNRPLVTTVTINNASLKMEVDTGASRSLIAEATFRRLGAETNLPPLRLTTTQLRTYTGEPLVILGTISIPVTYQDQVETLELMVVQGEGPSLMGKDWLEKIRLDWHKLHNIQQPQTLEMVLNRHQEVFSDELGKIKHVTAKIHVDSNERPRFFRPRQVPYALRTRVEKELTRLEEQGVIEPVQFSEWAAPIVPVVKADGSIRICGDYKVTVNRVAKLDTYPLPRIDDLFASLAGGKAFTKLDLAHAYQQVMLDEESKKFVTVNTHKGLYTYNRLPFGVASAPSIFQRTMESILQGVPQCLHRRYLDHWHHRGRASQEPRGGTAAAGECGTPPEAGKVCLYAPHRGVPQDFSRRLTAIRRQGAGNPEGPHPTRRFTAEIIPGSSKLLL